MDGHTLLNIHSLGHTLVHAHMYIYTQEHTHTQKGQLGRGRGDTEGGECNQNIHTMKMS